MKSLKFLIVAGEKTVWCLLFLLSSTILNSLCGDLELKNAENVIKRIADNDAPFVPMIKNSYTLDKKQRHSYAKEPKGQAIVADSMATSSDHSDYSAYYYDVSQQHADGYALDPESPGHYHDDHQLILSDHHAIDPYYNHYDPSIYHRYPEQYHSYGDPHYGHSPQKSSIDKYLVLKKLLFPLAGIALLGAAAVFVSNPVLLQLGVISGKRRRRRRHTNLGKQYQLYYKST